MPNKSNTTSDDSDGEESDEKTLATRARLTMLALWAWVKPRAKSAAKRVRDELAQATDELAPQLRGALSGVSVPKRALKPLALVVVLLFAAVALGPAAPFAGDSGPVDNGTEPVVGTTYEPVDEGEYRQVVTSRIGSLTSDAPPAPNEVRASAGSQTMRVETSVRDGDPVIVLEDDRTHEGRWVALETSWFEENVGEVPEAAFVEHESGDEYSTPIETRGGEAAFYVQEFSTNTISFDGELTVSADNAMDGDSITYDAPNGGEDLSINVTGVENTAQASMSGTYGNGESATVGVGGNQPPQSATVTIEGHKNTYYDSKSDSSVTNGGSDSVNIGGTEDVTGNLDITFASGQTFSSSGGSSQTIQIPDGATEVYIETTGYSDVQAIGKDGEYYNIERDGGFESGDGTYDISMVEPDSNGEVRFKTRNTGDSVDFVEMEMDSVSGSVTVGGETESFNSLGGTTSRSVTLSAGSTESIDVSLDGGSIDYDLSWTEVTKTNDPSASVAGKTVSYSGTLEPGQTVSESVDLSPGSETLDMSTTTGNVDVMVEWTEVTETRDPVVELNGETTDVDGTLADGETTSLPANDSWIEEGTNQIDVSLGDGSITTGPEPKVGVEVQHDIAESRTINYSAEAFSERYSVSKTWSENTSNATLTIPWASDNVVAVRDLNVDYSDSGGVEPSPRPTPQYTLENGSVVVDLGDVESGWETTIEANGSKVQVDGADLEVLDPTDQGEDLNSRVRFANPSDDVYVRVGATDQGQQLHYLSNASWDTAEASRISADGTNELRIPNVPDNGEAVLRTLPLAFDVNSGAIDVDVPDERVNTEEPVYRIGPGDRTGDSYSVTHVEAADGKPYVLYDESDDIVLDQGLASSPLTLSATEPEEPHVIQFRQDDGVGEGSADDGTIGSIGGGGGPMVTNSRPFSALSGLLPGRTTILVGLVGLVGLAVLSRETSLFDEGTRSDAVADAAKDVGGRAGGLVERVLENEIVVAALMLGAGAWLLSSGVFGPTERLIVALGSVPVAMYLALRQFGTFDFRVWVGSTAVVAVLGVVVLAPDVFESLADEAGVIIVAGVILLGWRALSAWRAEANTPDEVTNLEVTAEETDDGN